MGKFEVTQAQWRAVMGGNPSYFKNCGDDCPVEQVSWNDAQDFISRLNLRTGKKFRLPTEAEWEYAARSGGKGEKWAGTSRETDIEDYAWFHKNSGGQTRRGGQKKPNGIGLFDMSGNSWEWCQDWFDIDYYQRSPRDNPIIGPRGGSLRVLRGGPGTTMCGMRGLLCETGPTRRAGAPTSGCVWSFRPGRSALSAPPYPREGEGEAGLIIGGRHPSSPFPLLPQGERGGMKKMGQDTAMSLSSVMGED